MPPKTKVFARFEPMLQEENEVVVSVDKSCDMAKVEFNGHEIMRGNFWDFRNECHGMYDVWTFNSHQSLADILATFVRKRGKKLKVIERAWKYKD